MPNLPAEVTNATKSAVIDLFAENGITDVELLQTESSTFKAKEYCSVLNFTGDHVQGIMLIATDANLLEKSHPNQMMEMPVEQEDISDWAGEVVNQLLGRLKNELYGKGLTFTMGTPTVISGISLESVEVKDKMDKATFYFRCSDSYFVCQIKMLLDPAFQFSSKGQSQVEDEGASILF